MNQLLHEMIPLVSQYGLWIIFFGMMIEGTMMIFTTGVLCYLGMLNPYSAFVVAVLGAVLGDQLWYFLGKYYGEFVEKHFTLLYKKIQTMKERVETKGKYLAFAGRFVYGGAILFPLTLGTYNYSHKRFTFFDLLGVSVWGFCGIFLGYLLGSSVEQFIVKITKVWHVVVLVLCVVGSIWLLKYIVVKIRRKKDI